MWLIHNTKESMLWNYKTFHFSPKMRQMMYPDCKATLNTQQTLLSLSVHFFTPAHIIHTIHYFPACLFEKRDDLYIEPHTVTPRSHPEWVAVVYLYFSKTCLKKMVHVDMCHFDQFLTIFQSILYDLQDY